MARRPRNRASRGAGKFDEAKHPREHGRFADKSGGPSRTDLKPGNVERHDIVVELGGAGREAGTVGDYLDRVGHETGLRTLARLHAEGKIGFRAGKAPKPKPPVARDPWPGKAEVRNLSGDKVQINKAVLTSGLFRDEAHAREVTAALTAGTPQGERLRVRWFADRRAKTVHMTASGGDETEIHRAFSRNADGSWTVDHEYFTLPRSAQGSGGARRMMRASVEAYDGMNVSRIEVLANIDVGGYAWARYGFTANNAARVRRVMGEAAARNPRDPVSRAVRSTLNASGDDDLMYNLARIKTPDGQRRGFEILENARWDGHIDLTNTSHRARVVRAINE